MRPKAIDVKPLKNYILLALILIITIILVVYFYMWYGANEKNKLAIPIMNEHMQIIKYNELNNYLIENKNPIIYSSILGDRKIRNFEIKFKKLIIDNSLNGKILYLNLTSEVIDKQISKEIKEKYKIDNRNIAELPSLTIFKDGKPISIYNIKEDNYNIKKVEKYLEEQGVIND